MVAPRPRRLITLSSACCAEWEFHWANRKNESVQKFIDIGRVPNSPIGSQRSRLINLGPPQSASYKNPARLLNTSKGSFSTRRDFFAHIFSTQISVYITQEFFTLLRMREISVQQCLMGELVHHRESREILRKYDGHKYGRTEKADEAYIFYEEIAFALMFDAFRTCSPRQFCLLCERGKHQRHFSLFHFPASQVQAQRFFAAARPIYAPCKTEWRRARGATFIHLILTQRRRHRRWMIKKKWNWKESQAAS